MLYHIEVYGCQMNVRDSRTISGILSSAGFRETDSPEEADVILLVSCAVRERAETRVLGRASQLGGMLRGRKRGRPLMVLCGCVAQEHGDSLLDRFAELDLAVGPDCYRDLPRLIEGSRRRSVTDFRNEAYEGIEPAGREYPRAFVTIMRGCDNFCSYCIVPFVRGRERCRDRKAILAEVEDLRDRGFGEITLLGQNVNSYREAGTGFHHLLGDVSISAGNAWVRFVTSHPRDLDRSTVDVIASRGNICRQLHLPLQSGSDTVLRSMNRGYTAREYLEKIVMLREAMPGIVLSTDIIAGFPGETLKDFQRTADLIEEIGFDYAFLFRYSERRGTAACGFPGGVPEGERLRRLGILQDLQRGITIRRSRALVGSTRKVLVTGPAKYPGQRAGRTEGNRMVVIENTDAEPGDLIDVRITRADGWTHFGEPAGAVNAREC